MADGWWLALTRIEDHKTQVRCSAVCKEWRLLCSTLPKLRIKIGIDVRGKKKAERFIRRALRGRSGLQEIIIDYDCMDEDYKLVQRAPADEANILYMLKHVSGSLKELTLQTPSKTTYSRIWSQLEDYFPRLQKLSIHFAQMPGNGPGIVQQHRNLKDINFFCCVSVPGSFVEELVNSCPFLEKLSVSGLSGSILISSRNLVKITLGYFNKRDHVGETYIKAPALQELCLMSSGPSTIETTATLRELSLFQVMSICMPFQIHNLVKLHFSGVGSQDMLPMMKLISCASNLKHLVVGGDFGDHPADLMLVQLVPSQVEFFHLQTRLVRSLKANEAFQKESIEEIAEMMHLDTTTMEGSDLPSFSLKMATVDLRDVEDAPDAEQLVVNLLAIFVQLLKCSPQLEYLVIGHPGDTIGPLLVVMVDDPRYHVWWGHHACWAEKGSPKCLLASSRCFM